MDSDGITMDEPTMKFYNITCATSGCVAENFTIRGLGVEGTTFICGSCGQIVDNVTVCEDQETKDGCIAFCPDSNNHHSFSECIDALNNRTRNGTISNEA